MYKPGMMVHDFDSSYQETKAQGCLWVSDHPELQRETLSWKEKRIYNSLVQKVQ